MAKRKKKKGFRKTKSTPCKIIDESNLESEIQKVRHLLSIGSSKAALQDAKKLLNAVKSKETEALLLDTYFARIQSLKHNGMTVEAIALLDVVQDQYSHLADLVSDRKQLLQLHGGNWDPLLEKYVEENLSQEEKGKLDELIRLNLTDPGYLANSNVLPDEHELKRSARDIQKALHLVTTRPVSHEEIALQSVSRKSPLAAWKLLIRAIAHYYRDETEACHRHLDAIPSNTSVKKMVPVLNHLIEKNIVHSTSKEATLVRQVASTDNYSLLKNLKSIEHTLENLTIDLNLPKLVRRTFEICEEEAPHLRPRLLLQFCIKCYEINLPAEFLKYCRIEHTPKDSTFWLFVALEAARNYLPGNSILIEYFIQFALEQKELTYPSPEVAWLYSFAANHHPSSDPSHFSNLKDILAELQSNVDKEHFKSLSYDRLILQIHHKVKDNALFSSSQLYQKCCEMDPRSEYFQQWWDYSLKYESWKETESIGKLWHRSLPTDLTPLLLLIKQCHHRKAFSKALQYLEKAEKIDGLNSTVREARFQLLIRNAHRHLEQDKANLLAKDIQDIEKACSQGDKNQALMILALRCLHALIDEDFQSGKSIANDILKELGTGKSVYYILSALSPNSTTLDLLAIHLKSYLFKKISNPQKQFIPSFLTVFQAGVSTFLHMTISTPFCIEMKKIFKKESKNLSQQQIIDLAELVWWSGSPEFVFEITEEGFSKSTDWNINTAYLLFHRGRSLIQIDEHIARPCFHAAFTLANRFDAVDLLKLIDEKQGFESFSTFMEQNPDSEDYDDMEIKEVFRDLDNYKATYQTLFKELSNGTLPGPRKTKKKKKQSRQTDPSDPLERVKTILFESMATHSGGPDISDRKAQNMLDMLEGIEPQEIENMLQEFIEEMNLTQ